jgi:hypothetical protein
MPPLKPLPEQVAGCRRGLRSDDPRHRHHFGAHPLQDHAYRRRRRQRPDALRRHRQRAPAFQERLHRQPDGLAHLRRNHAQDPHLPQDTYISLDYQAQEAFAYKKENHAITKTAIPIEKEEPIKKEIESFTVCVRNHRKPVVSGIEAYEALKLATKITRIIHRRAARIF